MNIPQDPSIGYIAAFMFLSGLFLFIAGIGVIKFEKIIVHQGMKTWIIGIVLMLVGGALGAYKQLDLDDRKDKKQSQTEKIETLVKYGDLQISDILYTRGCSKSRNLAWINRFQVKEINNSGVAWGSFEQAKIYIAFPNETWKRITVFLFSKISVSLIFCSLFPPACLPAGLPVGRHGRHGRQTGFPVPCSLFPSSHKYVHNSNENTIYRM